MKFLFDHDVPDEMPYSLSALGHEVIRLREIDIETFKQVQLDTEAGTVVWPNGVDFCPDVLRHYATGAPLPGDEPHRTASDRG